MELEGASGGKILFPPLSTLIGETVAAEFLGLTWVELRPEAGDGPRPPCIEAGEGPWLTEAGEGPFIIVRSGVVPVDEGAEPGVAEGVGAPVGVLGGGPPGVAEAAVEAAGWAGAGGGVVRLFNAISRALTAKRWSRR